MSAYKASVDAQTEQVYSRVFRTDYDLAWQAVLESLKSSRLDISNREGGYLQTKWIDNTGDKKLADTLGIGSGFLKSQYRIRVTLSKGFYSGESAVRVSIQKEQVVQRDLLEPMKPVDTDGIEENTMLYRISRIIVMRMEIQRIEKEKTNEAIESAPIL